jgi:hypothetical protein
MFILIIQDLYVLTIYPTRLLLDITMFQKTRSSGTYMRKMRLNEFLDADKQLDSFSGPGFLCCI